MFYVGTRKGLFRIVEGKVASTAFLSLPVTAVLARGQTVWVGLQHGHFGPKLHRSDDGGLTFTEVASPAFPEGLDASVHTLWCIEQGQDGTLWVGTIPGGLFRSTDRGASFELVRPLWDRPERARWFGGGFDKPGIHSICIDPGDPKKLIVGVSVGGVWRSEDGGESFAMCGEGMQARYMPEEKRGDGPSQDPHRIVQSPVDPRVLWCQHHSGVWRSADGAGSWQELAVPPSSFGFAVATHPHKPDTAWFVPADSDDARIPVRGQVVVARTRDGGRSFDVLTNGLPQEHAYDLVFRHALDVDSTGDRLLFGSTTGSAWYSEDGGDRWQVVTHHLPPVYVVRSAS